MTLCLAMSLTHTVCAELLPYPLDTINGQVVYKYRVPRSIGIYRISVNFEVTQQEIIDLNPQLKERGLHYDELIYVPVKKEELIVTESVATNHVTDSVPPTATQSAPKDTIVAAADSLMADSVLVDTVKAVVPDTFPKIKIALLLPLQAESVQRDANMDRFVDFYEGCLIGLYDLQWADHFELHVFDIGKTDLEVKRLIADSTLHKMDAIIGPTYPAQVEPIARLAKEDSILTLIPFTDRVPDIQTNPFLMQFNPSAVSEAKALVDYLLKDKAKVNCVFIESRENEQPLSIRTFQQEAIAHGIPHTKATMRQILADSLYLSLKDSVENILVFNTEKFSNLQILLPHAINGKAGQHVTLYSQYSWQKENILLPQIYTSVFTTTEPADISHYDEVFAKYFKHEHASSMPRFDLLGYDLTRQLIAIIQGKEYFGLQSDMQFERVNEQGGWINTKVQVIRK